MNFARGIIQQSRAIGAAFEPVKLDFNTRAFYNREFLQLNCVMYFGEDRYRFGRSHDKINAGRSLPSLLDAFYDRGF
jgi:hypothetical protein